MPGIRESYILGLEESVLAVTKYQVHLVTAATQGIFSLSIGAERTRERAKKDRESVGWEELAVLAGLFLSLCACLSVRLSGLSYFFDPPPPSNSVFLFSRELYFLLNTSLSLP